MIAEEKNGSNIVWDILSYPDETKNRFNDSNIFSPIWQPEPVSEQTTGMLLAANPLAASSMPIAVGWSLDESPVQPAFWLFMTLMLIMLVIVLGFKNISKMDTNESKSAQI